MLILSAQGFLLPHNDTCVRAPEMHFGEVEGQRLEPVLPNYLCNALRPPTRLPCFYNPIQLLVLLRIHASLELGHIFIRRHVIRAGHERSSALAQKFFVQFRARFAGLRKCRCLYKTTAAAARAGRERAGGGRFHPFAALHFRR